MIGVLGIGEVGNAILSILEEKYHVLKKDIKFDEIKKTRLEVLHVCIPYNKNFLKSVVQQIKKNRPSLVIVHSTVKPGTTSKIAKNTKSPVVHSPVMGTHPNLKRDILKFPKFIGPVNNKSANLAVAHFKSVGIKIIIFNNPLETELGKLLDTTYYAWNIIFSKFVWNLCKSNTLDFDNVYTKFNEVYNTGYQSTKPNVIRPILKYLNGPIGGHCIIPNAQILEGYRKNPISRFVLDFNNSQEKSKS
ncbi:MAG: EsV-1-83 [Microgenomates group bacterium GW2011_GWA2_44_7]|nr:MAG: EsV-1-83 [Microgenomates group bacterium GW2011_GWA2_44_7]